MACIIVSVTEFLRVENAQRWTPAISVITVFAIWHKRRSCTPKITSRRIKRNWGAGMQGQNTLILYGERCTEEPTAWILLALRWFGTTCASSSPERSPPGIHGTPFNLTSTKVRLTGVRACMLVFDVLLVSSEVSCPQLLSLAHSVWAPLTVPL